MTYYLLWASQGEYSDRREWPCAIYGEQDAAQADVLRGSALWREITGGHGWVAYDDRERIQASPQWAELKAICDNEQLDLYDDLTLTCCEIELRAAPVAAEGQTP